MSLAAALLLLLPYLYQLWLWPQLHFQPHGAMDIGSSQEISAPENPASQAVIARQAPGSRRPSSVNSSTSNRLDAIADEDLAPDDHGCWLCGTALEELGNIQFYRQREVHVGCASAMRCHDRLLKTASDEARAADNWRLQQDPQGWKNSVMTLEPPVFGNRDTSSMRNYSARLETFAENSILDDAILLSKSRYKAWHRQWDDWGSETASERFELALEAQSGNESDSDGNPRVWQTENLRRQKKTGYKSIMPDNQDDDGSGNGRRPGRDRDRDRRRGAGASSAGSSRRRESERVASRRRRSRSRSGGEELGGRRRRTRSVTPPASGKGKLPRPSPESSSRARGGGGGNRSTKGKGLAIGKSGGGGGSGKGGGTGGGGGAGRRRVRAKQTPEEALDPEADGDTQVDPVAFLAKKAELKKGCEAELRKLRLKTSVGNALAVAANKLTDEQLLELKKTGDHEAVAKVWKNAEETFKTLGADLKDVTHDSLASWEARFNQTIVEVEDAKKRGGHLR